MGSPVWRWRRGLKPCPCYRGEPCRGEHRLFMRIAARESRKAQEAKAREKREGVASALAAAPAEARLYVHYLVRRETAGKAHVSRDQRGKLAKRNRRDNGR